MTLFIQNAPGTLGTGAVSTLHAWLDIFTIANDDLMNVGPAAVAGRPDLEQVTYAPQVATGPCPTRLFNLVNTNYNVNANNIDIIVIAGGDGFALNDGSLIRGNGTSLEPNATFGGVVFNPSDSVVVVYDITQNDGQGICCKPQSGSDLDLPIPNSVILYHELSHALRQATNSTLNTNEPDCNSASPEESAAEVDENDMRDQLVTAAGGTPDATTRRDTGNHCGASCGGYVAAMGDCCIIASIASGSPYSQEVNMLRRVRDQFLRKSTVGLDFFDHLHDDYYAFSPQVCRLMAENSDTRWLVGAYFVRPLVLCLNLIHDYAIEGCGSGELGRRFLVGVEGSPELSSLNRSQVLEALDLLCGKTAKELPGAQLTQLIDKRARTSEYVRWALIEPLEFYVEALLWRLDGLAPEELGRRLVHAIEQWGTRLPISEVWGSLSNRAFREELAFLKQALLKNPDARARFARRLPHRFWENEARAYLLESAGFWRERGA